jgi:hypothetical protein
MRLRRDGSDSQPLAAPVVKDLVDTPLLAAESFIMVLSHFYPCASASIRDDPFSKNNE